MSQVFYLMASSHEQLFQGLVWSDGIISEEIFFLVRAKIIVDIMLPSVEMITLQCKFYVILSI